MSALSSALACATLLAAAPASTQTPPPEVVPAQPVLLRFAWPDTLKARVTARLSLRTSDATPETRVTLSYPLHVEVHGWERWVVSGPFEVSPPESRPFYVGNPTYVLNPSGHFLRAVVSEPIIEATARQWGRPLEDAGSPQDRAELREEMLRHIEEYDRTRWGELVDLWRGERMTPGLVKTRPMRLRSPVLGGTTLWGDERLTFESPVPCEKGALERRCVRIRRVREGRPEELERRGRDLERSLNDGSLRLMPKGKGPYRLNRWEERETVELVTEPDTLRPHRFRAEQVHWMVETWPGEKPQAKGQRSSQDYTFTYEP